MGFFIIIFSFCCCRLCRQTFLSDSLVRSSTTAVVFGRPLIRVFSTSSSRIQLISGLYRLPLFTAVKILLCTNSEFQALFRDALLGLAPVSGGKSRLNVGKTAKSHNNNYTVYYSFHFVIYFPNLSPNARTRHL